MPPFWPFLILFGLPAAALVVFYVRSASLREGGAVDEAPTLTTRGSDITVYHRDGE